MECEQKQSVFSLSGSFYKTVHPFLWSLPISRATVEAYAQGLCASTRALRQYNEHRAPVDPHGIWDLGFGIKGPSSSCSFPCSSLLLPIPLLLILMWFGIWCGCCWNHLARYYKERDKFRQELTERRRESRESSSGTWRIKRGNCFSTQSIKRYLGGSDWLSERPKRT